MLDLFCLSYIDDKKRLDYKMKTKTKKQTNLIHVNENQKRLLPSASIVNF